MPRALLPRLIAVLVAAAGLVVLGIGVSRGASSADSHGVVGRLPRVGQPMVVTASGVVDLAGSTLRVEASTADRSRPVFIGVGRADDVDAYLATVARAEVTSTRDGLLQVRTRAGDTTIPDPAGVDVWAAEVRGQGDAALTWPRTPGDWRLVVASDGGPAPEAVQFTWSGSAGSSTAPALIAVGAVLFVVGLIGFLAIRSGLIFAATDDEDDEDDRGDADEDREAAQEGDRVDLDAVEAAPVPALSGRRAARIEQREEA